MKINEYTEEILVVPDAPVVRDIADWLTRRPHPQFNDSVSVEEQQLTKLPNLLPRGGS